MLRVSLIGKQSGNQISARALLDLGAEGMIIDHNFAMKHSLTLRTLRHPLPVKNVDGSLNKAGPIRHTTIQTIRIPTPDDHYHEERSEFYVTAVGTHDVILGTDWLKAHNPELDWTTSHLAFTRCPQTCILTTRPLHISPIPSRLPAMYISRIEPASDPVLLDTFADAALPKFLKQHELFKQSIRPVVTIRKTTHATKLASGPATPASIEQIPAQFQQYRKLFNEQASQRLPAHQSWDHAIDLKPGAPMKNRGIYRLTPIETAALHEYIADHLKRGYIRPSKSPVASPFFFISKKSTNTLRPVQDYRDLNDITVKNATPLPLIPELIDKLQGSRYFIKFDVRWGYNNIRIRDGDE